MRPPRLVVSVKGSVVSDVEDRTREALRLGADLVEIRLDFTDDPGVIRSSRLLRSLEEKLILTFRSKAEGGVGDLDEHVIDTLYEVYRDFPSSIIDLELTKIRLDKRIARIASRLRERLIVSWHTSSPTTLDELLRAYEEAKKLGRYVKLVVAAKDYEDNIRLLKLYDLTNASNLIAFCMGEKGVLSRILSGLKGSPFVYTCLPSSPVAEGQLPVNLVKEIYSLLFSERRPHS